MTLRRLNASVLSPLLAFPIAWAFGALLAQVHVLGSQTSWDTVMIAVVVAVPLAFVAGGLIGEGIATATTTLAARQVTPQISERTFRRVLIAIVAIGLLEVAHQFAKAGTVPLLSGSIDSARFSEGGPTILLTDLLTVAAVIALAKPPNPLAREARFELGTAVVALGAFGLQGGRGSVVLPIIVAIIARWLYWGRPSAYLITAGGLVALLAICFGFYLRVYQHPTTPFEAELFGEVLPPLPFFVKPLVPLYLAITTNFIALQGIVGHFPTVGAFGHGAYDAVAFDRFVSISKSVSDVSTALTPPWVTSTVAGPLWADGGFLVLVPGVAMTGGLAAGAYAAATRTLSFRWSLVAAYLLFVAVFGLYTNLWTQQIDWIVVSLLLLIFGAFAEDPKSPPGVVGVAWGKIRRMRTESSPASGEQKASGENSESGRSYRTAIFAGGGVLAILMVAGQLIQATLPDPYPLVSTQRLPKSVASAQAVMTDSDRPGDNSIVWWVNVNGDRVSLRAFNPSRPREAPIAPRRFRLAGASSADFDIARWPPLRSPALFVIRQRGQNLETQVRDIERNTVVDRFISTVGPPTPGAIRDMAVATNGGIQPDLFIVDRNRTDARVELRILSGETGFRRQTLANALPFRGLSPSKWSLDIGSVSVRPPVAGERKQAPRPDIALVEKDPGRAHANLKAILGEDSYDGFAFQRDLDIPGRIPADSIFLIGAKEGATALYEVLPRTPRGPLLRVFSIEPPTGLL